MKKINRVILILLCGMLYAFPDKIYSQTNQKEKESKMEANQTTTKSQTSERIFIDRFMVPQKSKPEFIERMNINRNLIKTLPGFIEDSAYERTDEQGNLICVTVAVWASEESIKNAREAVQAAYKKEGFNLPAMLERLNITMIERGVYTKQVR
jgi:heme-degrading monooxygenase HmoA